MAEPIPFRYRAFLSYSHADTRAAKRLHRALESFRIDKDLVGRPSAQGAIPKTLRPIFRDRDDFTAGHTLTEQTIAALDASAALIVLCSPVSAKSHYVNEEVRLFKSRHPERPVVPVIIDGTPGDAERECFPPALRFEVSAEGAITDTPDNELAADIRESGDGFDLGVAKVVARLLGLATDDVFRRAERARRRGARIRNGVLAIVALLAIAAAGSAVLFWQELKTNQAFLTATLTTATEIVNTVVAQAEKYNVPRTATLEVLKTAEGLFDDMARFGHPTPELQREKAWMLIQFARNYEILGDTTKQRERAEEAHKIMAALAERGEDTAQRDLAAAEDERGTALAAQGKLDDALAAFRNSLAIMDRLSKADPGNAGWQRDLAIAYDKVGGVEVAQGNLPEAFKSYQASLAIVDRLAKTDPANSVWQRDLSVSYEKVGNVLVAQGKLDDALTAFRGSLAIRDRLAKQDPGNAGWQRDLSVSYEKVGDVLVAQGKLDDALTAFRDSLTIFERLAKLDPGNAGWQRDLSVSYEKVGDMLAAQGKLDDALTAYRDSLAVFDRLAKQDPANAGWQRDLSHNYIQVGDVLRAQGKLPEALTSYQTSLAIRERLANADPTNPGWQRDLAVSHAKLAAIYGKSGERERAIAELKAGREIMLRMVALTPTHAGWKNDLKWLEAQIAALEQ